MVTAATKLKDLLPWKKSYNKPRQRNKQQRYHFVNKDPSSQSYGFSSSHVWMWELDHKESWAPKNWCFRTVVLEKTLECPLNSKEIKPVNPKGNQLWIFTRRTDGEAEAPILWLPDRKSRFIGKDCDAGKDWRQLEKGQQRVRLLDGIIDSMDMSLSKLWEIVKDRKAWHATVRGVSKSQTLLSNWTTMFLRWYHKDDSETEVKRVSGLRWWPDIHLPSFLLNTHRDSSKCKASSRITK